MENRTKDKMESASAPILFTTSSLLLLFVNIPPTPTPRLLCHGVIIEDVASVFNAA